MKLRVVKKEGVSFGTLVAYFKYRSVCFLFVGLLLLNLLK